MKLQFAGNAKQYPDSLVGKQIRFTETSSKPLLEKSMPGFDLSGPLDVFVDTGRGDFDELDDFLSTGGWVRRVMFRNERGQITPKAIEAELFDVIA